MYSRIGIGAVMIVGFALLAMAAIARFGADEKKKQTVKFPRAVGIYDARVFQNKPTLSDNESDDETED